MDNVLREKYEHKYKIKIKEKEINNYVYYFIKTNYTEIDILNAFKSYESFEKFMKEIEYRLSQDEGFRKIL